MSRRMRTVAGLAAALLLVLGAVPIAHASDRLLPHAIQLWDVDECGPSDASDHALFAVAGPVLPPGHPDVQILDAHPLGLADGTRWRTWVVPVPARSSFTGALGTRAAPAGWPERRAAAGSTVSSDRRAELDLEVWPGPGRRTTAVRGFLVTYRTAFGITRTVRTPTALTTRVGGCA